MLSALQRGDAGAALRDRFVGSDGERIEDIWQTAYRLGFYRGGPVLMSASSEELWWRADAALVTERVLGGG